MELLCQNAKIKRSSVMTFVYNKGGDNVQDKPFDQYNRTNAGDPTGSVTPQYAGERILDTTNGTLYQALGAASSSWVQLTV